MAFVGKRAPDFETEAVYQKKFINISLKDYRGKYVILFFYPLDFTFVCPTEITAFSDRIQEFEALNTQVLGASVDSKFSHLAWIERARKEGGLGEIHFPLLADITKSIAREYEVLIEEAGIALRGLFIIDPEGMVKVQIVNDNAIGRSVDETLRLLQALQFNAKHGEVCPANWKPGADTIVPDAEKSKEYFRKAG